MATGSGGTAFQKKEQRGKGLREAHILNESSIWGDGWGFEQTGK